MYTQWKIKDAANKLRELNKKDGWGINVAQSLEMGAIALENHKLLKDEIIKLNYELKLIEKAYNSICEIYKQEKFDLLKLIERNQLAWNYSKDKECGMLPEVYLSNKHYIENRRT